MQPKVFSTAILAFVTINQIFVFVGKVFFIETISFFAKNFRSLCPSNFFKTRRTNYKPSTCFLAIKVVLLLLGMISGAWRLTAQDITGVYEGQYTCSNLAGYLSLELRAAEKNRLNGKFKIYAVTGKRSQPIGVMLMRGSINAQSGTFSLEPDRWEGVQPRGYYVYKMSGTYSQNYGSLQCEMKNRNCQPFQLTRQADQSSAFAQKSAEKILTLKSAPTAFKSAGGMLGKCNCLIKWSKQLQEEYPDMSLRHTTVDRIHKKAINLFANEYFVPVFGTSYDQIGESYRKKIGGTIRKCRQNKDFKDEYYSLLSVIDRPFNLELGSQSYEETVRMVVAQRGARQAYQNLVREIKDMAGTAQNFEYLGGIGYRTSSGMESLWPSEKQVVTDLVAQKRGKMAQTLVSEALNHLVAQPITYAKALSVQNFERKNGQYFRLISNEAATDIEKKLDAGLDETLMHLMKQEMQRIDGLSNNLADIEKSNQWHDGFQKDYLDKFQHPDVDRAHAHFLQKREQMLKNQLASLPALFEQTNDFALIDELAKALTHVSLRDASINSRIEQMKETRKQALKNAKIGQPAYAWYYAKENAKGVSMGELINRIESVAIEGKEFHSTISMALKSLGKRVDPASNFKIEIERDLEFLTYTSKNAQTGTETAREDIDAYVLKVRLTTNGEVYRQGYIYSNKIILSSGLVARIKRKGDRTDLAQNMINDVEKLVRDLFENNNNYAEHPISDEKWKNLMQKKYSVIEPLYRRYQHAKDISSVNNLFGIDTIGNFKESIDAGSIPGMEEYEMIKKGPWIGMMDMLTRSQISENDWNANKRWKEGLKEVGVPILARHSDFLPHITQNVSGASLNLNGDSQPEGVAIMSESQLIEPNCLVLLNNQYYRVAGTTLSHCEVKYAADELMAHIVDLTNTAIALFRTQLRLYSPKTYGVNVTKYESKPTTYTFEVNHFGDTDLYLQKGDKVELHASGTMTLGLFAGVAGPEGVSGFTEYNKLRDYRYGALLARIGNGEWEPVGNRKQIVAEQAGQLHFLVNYSDADRKPGVFKVTANVFKPLKK